MKPATTEKSQLLFCYGVDMGQDFIRECCASPRVECVASLRDYRIVFVGRSRKWDGAEEALVKSPGSRVWGVVYRLGYRDGDSLDGYKDIRLNGTGGRFHYPVTVVADDGRELSALLYQKAELGAPRKPSSEYLSLLVACAKARGLPEEYVAGLARIESSPAGYPVPRKTAGPGPILAGLTCDCGGA